MEISPACSEVWYIFGRERSHSLYDALQFPLGFGKRRGNQAVMKEVVIDCIILAV